MTAEATGIKIAMTHTEPLSFAKVAGHKWDVVVVGAGPAGCVAAHALSRRGLEVLLVDRAAFPRWKVCGCCLNPFTLGILASAGLSELTEQCGAVPIGWMRLAARRSEANVAIPGWRVLSRERLDAALVAAAIQAGARFLAPTHASLGPELMDGRKVILRGENHEEEITARLVLAANGLGSRLLLGEPGCALRSAPASRVGAGAVAKTAPEFYRNGVVYMAYGSGGYVGLVRLEDGRLDIAAALDVGPLKAAHNPARAAGQILEEIGWPAVPDLVELAWHGTPALTRQPARPAGARVFAVGDAAGYVEPFTGEGIGWALASGTAVVPVATRAVRCWHPSLADEWVAIQGRAAHSRRLCRAMTWVSRHPLLARVMIGAVAQLPWLAGPFVSQVGRGSRYFPA